MTGHDDSTINIVVVIIIIIRLFVGQLEGHLVCKKSALVSQSCFLETFSKRSICQKKDN